MAVRLSLLKLDSAFRISSEALRYAINALTSLLEVLQSMIKYKLLNINNIFMEAQVLWFTIHDSGAMWVMDRPN